MIPMLEARNLMVYYENSIALNNLSFEINEGEIVGILGSNSAGKSSLMYTLSGLIFRLKEIEERQGGVRIVVLGQVIFEGEDILHMSAPERVKKGIVLTQERHPVFKDFNVIENLRVATYINKRSSDKDLERVYKIFPALTKLKSRRQRYCDAESRDLV